VTVLDECTTEEQSSIMRYFCGKRLNAKDSHREMFPVYDGKCLPRKAVNNWVDKLPQGRLKVADDARPGRPVDIPTEATVQRMEELIRTGRRITIDSVFINKETNYKINSFLDIFFFKYL
jgi:hypothetical protein